MTYFTDSRRLQRLEREMKGVPGFERERPKDDFESPKTPDLRAYKFSDESNQSKCSDKLSHNCGNENHGRKEKADLPMCKAIHESRESD